jgi:hypothetical protein
MFSSNSFEERLSENCKLIFPTDSGELTKEGKEFLGKHSQSDNLDIRYDIFIILFLSLTIKCNPIRLKGVLFVYLFIIEMKVSGSRNIFIFGCFFTLRLVWYLVLNEFVDTVIVFAQETAHQAYLIFFIQRLPRRKLTFCFVAGMPHRKLNFSAQRCRAAIYKNVQKIILFCAGMPLSNYLFCAEMPRRK